MRRVFMLWSIRDIFLGGEYFKGEREKERTKGCTGDKIQKRGIKENGHRIKTVKNKKEQ